MVTKEDPHFTRELKVNTQKHPGDFFTVNDEPMGPIKGYFSDIISQYATKWMEKSRDKTKPFLCFYPMMPFTYESLRRISTCDIGIILVLSWVSCVVITSVDESVAFITAVHRRWVKLLRNLSVDQWERSFVHPESGREVGLKQNLALYDWHSRHHYAHIKNLVDREGW